MDLDPAAVEFTGTGDYLGWAGSAAAFGINADLVSENVDRAVDGLPATVAFSAAMEAQVTELVLGDPRRGW